MSSPAHPLLELALAHHRAGNLAEAEALYRQLLAAHPGTPDVLNLLGLLLRQRGEHRAGIASIRQAIAANPAVPFYHTNLGVGLGQLGELDAAVSAHEAAIRLQPDFADAHYNLGFVRTQQERWADAAECYCRTIALRPDLPDAHIMFATALANQRRFDAAVTAAREATALLPAEVRLWNNLGVLLQETGELDEAIEAWRAALVCDPREMATLNNLGNALKDTGRLSEAIDCLRRCIEVDPTSSAAHSNLILALHFDPATTAESLAAAHRRWCERHSDPLQAARAPHTNEPAPERRLRVGFLSADLCEHPVGRMLLPVLVEHDRQQIEIVCYFDGHTNDALAQQLRAQAALSRDTAAMSDAALAAQIRADGIDLLVDLALHSAGNRLPVFAHQPAPVQVSWLGYAGSSGLDAIDFRLSDARIDPPGRTLASEVGEVVRLPDSWCCYRPSTTLVPGARGARPVTFGSMNAFAKVNDRVLGVWARILSAVETSRLLMIAPAGKSRERVRAFFGQCGVNPERIEFVGRTSPEDYFRQYDQIDLALDSFPYNGMTTTCDALWMGVPVVALAGTLPVSRTALSLLTTVGLPGLVAENEDGYVRIAVELAQDPSQLAALRTGLRERMEASPLMNAPGFTRHLEAAFRGMWRQWCGNG